MRELLDVSGILKIKSKDEIAKEIAQRMKEQRKRMKLTQEELSRKSGVSFGSVKRFETKGEISLSSLISIAIALESEEDFDVLFHRKKYRSIQEVIDEQDTL